MLGTESTEIDRTLSTSVARVFISHASDMAQHPPGKSFVDAALDASRRAGMPASDMGEFTASAAAPEDLCVRKVRECDIYIGILGFRYGSIAPSHGISFTELEYRTARKMGIPCLMFLLAEGDDQDPEHSAISLMRISQTPDDVVVDERQKQFRSEIEAELTCAYFQTTADLNMLVFQALLEHRAASRFSNQASRRQVTTQTSSALQAVLKPYMADRKEQEERIQSVIRSLSDPASRNFDRPCVFVVHGRDRQSHNMFVSRLEKSLLPRLFRLTDDQAVHSLHFEFPRIENTDDRSLAESLLYRFNEKLNFADQLSATDLATMFRQPPRGPLLFHTQLLTPDFDRRGKHRIESFLRFWQSLECGSMPYCPVACLCVKYIERRGVWGMQLRRRKSHVLAYVERLREFTSDELQIEVLPELQDLQQSHVDSWLQDEFDLQQRSELVGSVRELFQHASALSMEEFADQTRTWGNVQ